MTEAAPDDVTLEESGRSERGISAEDSMVAMKSQLKLMKSLHQASTFDLGSVRRRQPRDATRATAAHCRPLALLCCFAALPALGGAELALLALSCAASVAISATGWRCRGELSATGYTVLGVANKMLTVLANAFVADARASAVGVGCLVACLLCAAAYSLAPPRKAEEKRT